MGYLFPKYGADGDFGNECGDAVAKFQKARGIGIDRVAGKNTWSELHTSKPKWKQFARVKWVKKWVKAGLGMG